MTLGDYLAAARGQPWVWGEHDCSAWPAKWAGIELPPYSSEAEAAALIQRAGGLIPLWEAVGAGHIERVDTPAAGDIGVIVVPDLAGNTVELGAIYTGKRWAFVPVAGSIATIAGAAAQAWRIVCPSS